jgi:DNA repair protein RadC
MSPHSTASPARGTPTSSLIRELPIDERPRERLLAGGAANLSDAELIGILLRTGTAGRSAIDVAREVLLQAGGLRGLAEATAGALRLPGLGAAKTATVFAAVEVARRLVRSELPTGDLLSHPEAVVRYLAVRYGRRSQELMGALFVDIRNRLVDECELYLGTLARAAVEPRAIFERALACRAAGFLLFHNHPSGDPSPSAEDLVFTRRLADAGEVMGIRLVDHLVVGGAGRFVSLRRQGGW